MSKVVFNGMRFVVIVTTVLMLRPGVALARGNPLHTRVLMVGLYLVDINFYEDPLRVDHPIELTIVPHDTSLQLTGRILVRPGKGMDASEKSTDLVLGTADTDQPGTLAATINFPVQGIWQVIALLSGPRGQGSANFLVRVLAPGPIPLWLAWLMGLSPMAGLVWVAWHQRCYRHRLLTSIKKEQGQIQARNTCEVDIIEQEQENDNGRVLHNDT